MIKVAGGGEAGQERGLMARELEKERGLVVASFVLLLLLLFYDEYPPVQEKNWPSDLSKEGHRVCVCLN